MTEHELILKLQVKTDLIDRIKTAQTDIALLLDDLRDNENYEDEKDDLAEARDSLEHFKNRLKDEIAAEVKNFQI